jgi:hypothetical protein
VFRLLCRYGHHAPVRAKSLIDINDMRQETYCKRCGIPMERQAGSGWRVQPMFEYDDQAPLKKVH